MLYIDSKLNTKTTAIMTMNKNVAKATAATGNQT